ncbi:MAG: hypothetical protein WC820_08350 [Spirochaetales bacterium]|jgi:hypothetical protein
MKKVLICLVLICAISVPAAFSQFRLELGVNAPVAVGYVTGSGTDGDIASTIEESGIIPIPNLALLLQANLGLVKIGVGVKAQSVIVYSLAYPVAQLELALGPLAIDASLGGYYFGYYAVGNVYGVEQMDILLPDLSVWLGFGKKQTFRLGAGAIGAIPSSFDLSAVPFVAYAGLKIVLE